MAMVITEITKWSLAALVSQLVFIFHICMYVCMIVTNLLPPYMGIERVVPCSFGPFQILDYSPQRSRGTVIQRVPSFHFLCLSVCIYNCHKFIPSIYGHRNSGPMQLWPFSLFSLSLFCLSVCFYDHYKLLPPYIGMKKAVPYSSGPSASQALFFILFINRESQLTV